jgi:hypothetical protein
MQRLGLEADSSGDYGFAGIVAVYPDGGKPSAADGERGERQREWRGEVDGDLCQQRGVRLIQQRIDGQRGEYGLHGASGGSERKYGDGDSDLGDGWQQVCFGDDYDHSIHEHYGLDRIAAFFAYGEYDRQPDGECGE